MDKKDSMLYHCFIKTPNGFEKKFTHIICSDLGIKSILFCDYKTENENPNIIALECSQALNGYFAGKTFDFNLPLDISGTPFQKKVWKTLKKIKFGEVWSYKDLAIAIGSAKYARAVGSANSKNLISIIIPCHRVIASNGKLSGYAGGIEIKKYLLSHERRFKAS